MSELEQLKKRIDESSIDGVLTSHIRDDYEPAGDMMMRALVNSGDYVQRKVQSGFSQAWRIFNAKTKPY